MLRGPAAHQVVESRRAVLPEVDDFTVENRRPGDRGGNSFAEGGKRLESVSVPGQQPTAARFHIRQRAKSVPFQFVNPVRVIERRFEARQWHGLEPTK